MFLKYIFNVLHFVSMACTIKTDLVETKKKAFVGQSDGELIAKIAIGIAK